MPLRPQKGAKNITFEKNLLAANDNSCGKDHYPTEEHLKGYPKNEVSIYLL